jgi:hypothetical protein
MMASAMLVSCSSSPEQGADSDGQRFRGWYEYGLETSRFVPCGADVRGWWVDARDSLAARSLVSHIEAAEGRPFSAIHQGRAYAVFRGDTSAAGRYGHLGGHDRELRVAAVDTLSRLGPQDCASPGSRDRAT